MGVLDDAKADLTALMRQDEEIAEEVDRDKHEQELAVRHAEVHDGDRRRPGGYEQLITLSSRRSGNTITARWTNTP